MRPDELDFLAEIERAAARPEPYATALALTLERFKAEIGTIHVLRGGRLELVAHAADLPAVVLDQIRVVPIGKGMAGLAVERRAPVTACNLQTDTSGAVRPGARATGMQGSICVPVLRGDEAVGALGIANRTQRDFDELEQALLLETGRRIAAWVA